MRVGLKIEVDLGVGAGLESEPRSEELKIVESNVLVGLLLFAVVPQRAESSFNSLGTTEPRGQFLQ